MEKSKLLELLDAAFELTMQARDALDGDLWQRLDEANSQINIVIEALADK